MLDPPPPPSCLQWTAADGRCPAPAEHLVAASGFGLPTRLLMPPACCWLQRGCRHYWEGRCCLEWTALRWSQHLLRPACVLPCWAPAAYAAPGEWSSLAPHSLLLLLLLPPPPPVQMLRTPALPLLQQGRQKGAPHHCCGPPVANRQAGGCSPPAPAAPGACCCAAAAAAASRCQHPGVRS